MARAILIALACMLLIAGVAGASDTARPADRLADLPMDDYAYDRATGCKKRPSPGALAFVDWLELNAGGELWGIMRCERLARDSFSLHAEGRAIDWHLDAARPADRREARRLIGLLLATDRVGNRHTLARRMGIQEIIWNCRAWWSGSERMGPYSVCFDERGRPKRGVSRTLAHRDHIHFGLSRAGAAKRTSFWRFA